MTGPEEQPSAETAATGSAFLFHEVGLHARPSVKVTKVAKGFRAKVELATTEGGPWIDAKSIVKVMAAKAPKGSTLYFRAVGEDAEAAVGALVALVEQDFPESEPRDARG